MIYQTVPAKVGISALITVLAFIYQSFGVLFVVLVLASTIDYATGIMNAVIARNLSSRISLEGIMRKLLLLLLVPLANIVDFTMIQTGYMHTEVLTVSVTSWLIATEVLSILENVTKAGVPVPRVLVGILAVFGAQEGEHISKHRKTRRNKK